MWFEVTFLPRGQRESRVLSLPTQKSRDPPTRRQPLLNLFSHLGSLESWLAVAKKKDEEIKIVRADTLDTGPGSFLSEGKFSR